MQSSKRLPFLIFCLMVPSALAQFIQQGPKLVSTAQSGGSVGWSVALSSDGNTALVGAPPAGLAGSGAAWVFTRSKNLWAQQGGPLTPNDAAVFDSFSNLHFGSAVALSADGNTAVIGGYGDNNNQGAAWVFTRSNGVWTQQGPKLTGSGFTASPGCLAQNQGPCINFGWSVGVSADGNTAIVGGENDNTGVGAAWIFSRTNGVWSQVGGKLVGTGSINQAFQGWSVAMSGDGGTAIVGGVGDNSNIGAAWVYKLANGVWTQQSKLVGSGIGGTANIAQGASVALSSDGNTAIVGGSGDNSYAGAAWVFTRNNGAWAQQGNKLVGGGASATALAGYSVALSSDGNTALLGGHYDNGSAGSVWAFTRGNGVWNQLGSKFSGIGGDAPGTHLQGQGQGWSVAISGDGRTAIAGAPNDASGRGAAWTFTLAPGGPTAPLTTVPGGGGGLSQAMAFNFTDPRGWQDLNVVNVLINNALDGGRACYLAYVQPTNSLYLLTDDGSTLLGPVVFGGPGSVGNSQCTITGAGSSAAGGGNVLTLKLNMSFSSTFAGNKVIYMAARDLQGNNSGWQPLGTWSVPTVVTFPAVGGVTPSHGASSNQTFVFTFVDTKGYQDLGIANILINDYLDGKNACYLAFSQPANTLYLVSDDGTGLTGMTLNGSGSISNSHCTINGSGSSVGADGAALTLTLNMTFPAAFNGNRVIYMAARDRTDANNSNWQAVGSWAVQQ